MLHYDAEPRTTENRQMEPMSPHERPGKDNVKPINQKQLKMYYENNYS